LTENKEFLNVNDDDDDDDDEDNNNNNNNVYIGLSKIL
jgi:hypothetical protein